MSEQFENTSYLQHEQHYHNRFPDDEAKIQRIEIFRRTDTVNAWLHKRLYDVAEPLMTSGTKWLTVGDGNGADGHFLEQKGCQVMCSDISDAILDTAKRIGFIKQYSKENAEKLSFADDSFDYVLCKESFHHFPRPYIALYEMLRVAKKGVVLMEPNDPVLKMPMLMWLCNVLDRFAPALLKKLWKNRYSFEDVGNFVYKISEREIIKSAMGIHLPAVAFKGFNDKYMKGVEKEILTPKSNLYKKVKRNLAMRDFICNTHLMPFGSLCAVVFKNKPDDTLKQSMLSSGFKYIDLPRNPYIV